jgi:hypothetical protein
MTQPPSNDYPAPGSPYSEPVDPYATPAQSYDAPVDPYATPVDPYAAPVDPYATPAETYVAPAEPYTTLDDTYGTTGPTGTTDTAKDEAANVKGTAQEEAANLKGTAQDEAANVAGTAKDEATAVKDTAVGAGQQVASVAADEAKNVAAETATQVKDVAKQAAGEASSKVSEGKQQLATLVHSAAKQLGAVGSGGTVEAGPLTDLAKQASNTVGEVGHWLETREPRELVSDLSDFARRRPAVFLVGAALAGVVAGRLTRGLIAEAKDNAAPATNTPATGYAPASYSEPVPSASYVAETPVQGGRYGDLASDDQVVGYGTDGPPAVAGYQGDVVR